MEKKSEVGITHLKMKMKQINAKNVGKALITCRLELPFVSSQSYYSSDAYKNICKYLGIKDTLKNRRKVQRLLLRNRQAVEAAMRPSESNVDRVAPINRVLRKDPEVEEANEQGRKVRVAPADNCGPEMVEEERVQPPKRCDEESIGREPKLVEENVRKEKNGEATDTPRSADFDYLEFVEDCEFPTSQEYLDEWTFFTDLGSANIARKSSEMTIGVEMETGFFRLVNLSPLSLYDASNLLEPYFYEILTDGENLRLHMLMDIPTNEVSDDRVLPKLLTYLKNVVSNLLRLNFGVCRSVEDYLVLRRPCSSGKSIEFRLMLPNVVFKNMASLARFCELVNKEVQVSSEGEVNAYYLRDERPAVYLRDTAPSLFSKTREAWHDLKVHEITEKDLLLTDQLEMSLISPPSIRAAEEALNFHLKVSADDELVRRSFQTERIFAAFETFGEVLTLQHVPLEVYLWFIHRLGRRHNIKRIQVLPYEGVVNIHFENLACRTFEEPNEHESYVQLHAESQVAYFLCDKSTCRQQLQVEDGKYLIKKLDFIIPGPYEWDIKGLVKRSSKKSYDLDTVRAAVSDDYIVTEEIKKPSTDLVLYSDMQERLREERFWRRHAGVHVPKPETGTEGVTGAERSHTKCPDSPVRSPVKHVVSEIAEDQKASSEDEAIPASLKNSADSDQAEHQSEADSDVTNSEAEDDLNTSNCGTEEYCDGESGDSDAEEVAKKNERGNGKERKSYFCPKKLRKEYIEIGTVELTTEQWETIWNKERNELRKRHFMATVARAFDTLKVFCVINLNSSRVTRKDNGYKIDLYCYCAFEECRNFIISINHTKSDVIAVDRERTESSMSVRMCHCEMNHGVQKYRTRHCSGVDRIRMKEELRFTKPSVLRLSKLRSEDRDFLKNGNSLDVKSYSVNRKIRSEDKKKVDMHDDPLIDVMLRMRRQLKAEELKKKEKEKKEKEKKEKEKDQAEGNQKVSTDDGEDGKSKEEKSGICTHDDGDASCNHKDEEKLDNHQFIQTVGQPFSIITHCSHRALVFDLAKKLFRTKSSKEVLTLHLDSTGSIVDRIPACNKTIYLYSLVINVKNIVLSISDYYASEHNIESIQGWLNRTNRFYNDASHKPLAPHVVTDNSAALIALACLALNKMPLDVYLNTCYRIVAEDAPRKEKEETKGRLCMLHLCVAHLAKSFATTLFRSYSYSTKTIDSKLSKKEHKELRVFLMSGLMLIPHLKSYDSIKEVLGSIFTLMLMPYVNETVDEAKKKLVEFKLTGEELPVYEVEQNVCDEVEEDEDGLRIDMLVGNVTYKKIGFYKDMLTIYENIEKLKENDVGSCTVKEKERNIYANEKVAKFILVNYTYLLPLWSGLLSPSGKTFSNANVEKWFDIFKNVILGGAGAERINRVLDSAERHVIGKSVELDFDMPKEGLTGRKRKEKVKKQVEDEVFSDPDEPEPINQSPLETKCSEERTRFDLKENETSKSEENGRSEGAKVTSTASEPFEGNSVSSAERAVVEGVRQDSDETEIPVDSFEGTGTDLNGLMMSDRDFCLDECARLTTEKQEKDVLLDAFDPNVEEYWNSKPRKRKSTYSAVFLSNWADQKKRKTLQVNKKEAITPKRKSSRESIENAKRRRTSLLDRPKEEFTYEDFILDYLNPETLVIQNYAYYSILRYDTFKGKVQDDISTCYPISKHTLLLKSHPNKRNERHDCTSYLYSRDYDALRCFNEDIEDTSSLWITSDIIDSAVSIFVRNVHIEFGQSVSVLTCHIARKVVVGRFTPDDVRLNKVDKHVNWVILPYNPSNHWIVIIVDVQRLGTGERRRLWYLDPMGKNQTFRKPSFRKIIRELSSVCPFVEQDDSWEQKQVAHPSQNNKTYSRPDTWNCGIYSLFFIESFLRQADSYHFHVPSQFNPDEYRIYIASLFLHHSLTMRDTCKTCGQEGPEGMKWVQCDYCCRWAHLCGACVDDVNVDWAELQRNSANVEFLCKLCAENQKVFNATKASEIAYYNDIYKRYSLDADGHLFFCCNGKPEACGRRNNE